MVAAKSADFLLNVTQRAYLSIHMAVTALPSDCQKRKAGSAQKISNRRANVKQQQGRQGARARAFGHMRASITGHSAGMESTQQRRGARSSSSPNKARIAGHAIRVVFVFPPPAGQRARTIRPLHITQQRPACRACVHPAAWYRAGDYLYRARHGISGNKIPPPCPADIYSLPPPR